MLRLLLSLSSLVVLSAGCGTKNLALDGTSSDSDGSSVLYDSKPVMDSTAVDVCCPDGKDDKGEKPEICCLGTPDPKAPTPELPDLTLPPGKLPIDGKAPGDGHMPGQNNPGQNNPGQNNPGQNNPPSASVPRILSLTHEGKGCPAGTVASQVSGDAQAFTLSFSDFVAVIGPDAEPSEAMTSCLVGLEVEVPRGMSYALLNLDTRGFVDLEDKVLAEIVNRFYSAQDPQKVLQFKEELKGPRAETLSRRRTIEAGQMQWSPCSTGQKQKMFFDTRVALSNQQAPTASGLLAVDSLDGEFVQKLSLQWKPCAS